MPRKQLVCLFCLKKVGSVGRKRKRHTESITENMFTSCFKYLPADVIGNSMNWGWAKFKKHSGPFCAICLESAEQLSKKNELVKAVEEEMQNFASSLTQSILQNRDDSVTSPFHYSSNIDIQILTKSTNDSTKKRKTFTNPHPDALSDTDVPSPDIELFDCYEEDVEEYHGGDQNNIQRSPRRGGNKNGRSQKSSEIQPLNSKNSSPAKPVPVLKKIVWVKTDSGELQPSIPCNCGMSFQSDEELTQHKLTCLSSTNQQPAENSATRNNEERKVRYRCGNCGYLAKSLQELGEHKQRHTKRTLVCSKCGEKFSLQKDLDDHNQIHVHTKHTCPVEGCGKTFKSRRLLHDHGDMAHRVDEDVDAAVEDVVGMDVHDTEPQPPPKLTARKRKPRPCPECDVICSSKTHLNYHMLSKHSDERPFECHQCHKRFKIKRFLQTHLQTHLDVRSYLCGVPDCGKSFARTILLQQHMKLEHSEDNFKCDLCGYKTLIESKLKTHMAFYHDESKEFACTECGIRVSALTTLQNHMRIHTGEKPFKCNQCGECFHTTSLLNGHKNKMHKEKYKCTECDYVGASASSLKSHIEYKHEEDKLFQCDSCKKCFKSKTTLSNHRAHSCKVVT